ncbi:MAG: lysyl-tRNA synthetase class 2 [Lentisphaeria bacterium]|jgi:lysyl-tRNA synthetase class 2
MSGETLQILVDRAQLFAKIRQFFSQNAVLEVDVPVLGASTVTDPQLASLALNFGGRDYFLQTSPEFFMKRLLAQGVGAIYSLGRAFRKDEVGRKHNPEFTMLEWYRPGFDEHRLIDEVIALIQFVCPDIGVHKVSYQSLFEQYIGLNPHTASIAELAEAAKLGLGVAWPHEPRNTWLDVLFTHLIEPHLNDRLTAVFDYPSSQCALAKLGKNEHGSDVARRFEVYWRGCELANGYCELIDPDIQRQRFEYDNQARAELGLPAIAIDEKFLAALHLGLPECSGVALGVDRLLMCILNASDIREVMPFVFDAL